MTRGSSRSTQVARSAIFGAWAIICGFLVLAPASAQQERPVRSDRTSGQSDSAQNRDQRDQYGQRRTAPEQDADRAAQDRASRSRGDQEQPQADQRGQRQPATDRSARTDRYDRPTTDREFRRDSTDRGEPSPERTRTSFRQRLGLELDRPAQGQAGLAITSVQQGSLAARAGFRTGDHVVSVDGRNVGSPQQLLAYLGSQSGRQVPVVIHRNGRQYTVRLSPDAGGGDVAWLGVYLRDSESDQEGAEVTQVYPAGPAARAGLRPGDLITQVDGQQVGQSADLISAIEDLDPGSRVKLSLTRNNQQVDIPVILGSRDSFVFRGQGEDRRDQSGDSGQDTQDDYFANLPPYAMQLEHERRTYEQHQRIETEIAKLQDEVRQLRDAIQQLRR